VVDGGLLSNFPLGIFDVSGTPAYPTLGFRLVDTPPTSGHATTPRARENLVQFGRELLNTMLTAHDRLYLDANQIELLYHSGQTAAEQFFTTWNFSAYKTAYRAPQPVTSRLTRLHSAMRSLQG
jgi:NTE family protein